MSQSTTPQPSGSNESAVLHQVVDMLRRSVCRTHEVRKLGDRTLFEPTPNSDAPLQRVVCRVDDARILVEFELGRLSNVPRMPVNSVWNLQAELPRGATVHKVERDSTSGLSHYRVTLSIVAQPIGTIRQNVIGDHFAAMERRARELQESLVQLSSQSLPPALATLADRIEPVPFYLPESESEERFGRDTAKLVATGPSTLSGTTLLACEHAVALLASAYPGPVVRPLAGELDRKNLLEVGTVVQRQSGLLVLPVLGFGASVPPYELGRFMAQLLRDLAARQIAVLFFGVANDVGSVFAPQGVEPDPLLPLSFTVPEVPLESLVGFAAQRLVASTGLSPAEGDEVRLAVLDNLRPLVRAEAVRCAGAAVRAVGSLAYHGQLSPETAAQRVQAVVAREEIVGGGQSQQPRPRSALLHERLADGLTGGSLLAAHKEIILGQDEALEQLYRQLGAQLRFGAPEKPLAVLMEGPPGVGKSASVEFLADRLGLDMLYIDAASFGSHMQAHSLLLGSGLGIVNSYVPGKFETASRSHSALEIADLDHAPDHVRGSVVELFLQLMDRGTIQTATGRTLAASNMLICYTCNLPEGDDFKMRRQTGFAPNPLSDAEVRERIEGRLSGLFSGAFLSRVGAPVVFSPLPMPAQRTIVRRLLAGALRRALSGPAGCEVTVRESAVDAVFRGTIASDQSFGVRRLAALSHQALLPVIPAVSQHKPEDAHWVISGRGRVLTIRRK